jgi:hypothetical protein
MLMFTESEEVIAKHYHIRSYHSKCGGEWIKTGSGIADGVSRKYEHICNKCNDRQLLCSLFPRIETKYYSLDSEAI